MALYSISNTMAGTQQTVAAAFKTLVSLTAATATLRRAWLYELEVGTSGQPAAVDCEVVWQWSRQTAAGTSTAGIPVPLDSADTAAGTVGSLNFTAEGTITAASELLTLALNQRNSQRWIARDEKSALIVPATNLAGIAGRVKSSAYVSTAILSEHFAE